ncbi:hypothetical protein TrRE_jg8358 [Triparma retinervis]|uniref:Uncharacterized protein n=1 Tax=Triparma retinervis TaxID=2557542 RepID=A0A9W7KTM5_9STRA|nr:hypothetical protein TrRE_jg8358 [Triparma retinervis]
MGGNGEGIYKYGLILAAAYIAANTFARDVSLASMFGLVSKSAFTSGLSSLGGLVEKLGENLLSMGSSLRNVRLQLKDVDERLSEKVEDVGDKVDEVKKTADLNSEKLDGVDGKVTYVQKGVQLLCTVVAEGLGRNIEAIDGRGGLKIEYDGREGEGEGGGCWGRDGEFMTLLKLMGGGEDVRGIVGEFCKMDEAAAV